MTDLEADIVAIVRKQGLTIVETHGENHLLLEGNAFLNLTSMAKALQHRVDDDKKQAYDEGWQSRSDLS